MHIVTKAQALRNAYIGASQHLYRNPLTPGAYLPGVDLVNYRQIVWDIYNDRPAVDAMVLPHFDHFRSELLDQFGAMWNAVKIVWEDNDPTPIDPATGKISYRKFLQEVEDTGVLRVFRSAGDHPLLDTMIEPHTGETLNSIFRAVHDFFGHIASGGNFGWKGETEAYYSHAGMFSIDAVPALFSETVAQQSGYYVTGDFVEQKSVYYNANFWTPPLA